MWLPKVTWKSFLACGLGGFRLLSSWCLGFFASAVSRWCLHRLGMCSVAPKIVFFCCFMWIPKVTWKSFLACGLGGFRLVSRWCLGLFASAVSRWCLHRLGMCSVAPKIVFVLFMWIPKVTWKSFLACGLGGFRLVSKWCLGLFASAVFTWCLHRLGMCSVAPKIVLRGCFRLFYLCGFQRWRERVFWLAVWAVFGSCPAGV